MSVRQVLVIDDNPSVAAALRVLFRLRDISTIAAATPQEGLSILASEHVDLVIADMNFSRDTTSGEEGTSLFRAIRARNPDLPVILLTAWTNLESAVDLVKAGAADYIAKPWNNTKLLATVENLLELSESTRERVRMNDERRRRRRRLAEQFDLGDLVFESQAMESVVELTCRIAASRVPVLITGPNGVGKDRIANMVHANSPVRNGPFVVINCGALPSELVEAELFGVEAGAYTGAKAARPGRFSVAEGGTLFLDEIGNLPLSGQVKLLRVLESGQYERLGSSRTYTADVRIISATNADLRTMIRDGRFREDLYYRLNVVEIAVPSLAERPEDIVPLACHFLGDAMDLTEEARVALRRHPWPGNVRELRNCIERAKLLAQGSTVTAAHLNLPPVARAALPQASSAGRDVDQPSRALIEETLKRFNGNVSRAAQSLGLSRQALYRRLDRFGIRPPGQG